MSIMAMTWAWGLTDLDQSQTLVLLALADAANDEGMCWPSQAEIGRKARLKDRAVRNQIRSLEAAGLLSVSRRATPQGRKTNVYRLNIGCDFSLQSKQPARNAGWVEGSEPEPVDNSTFRCNQSNRHEVPVGYPTGTVVPVATGTVMPVASIYQTPNIQTPNPTQPSPALNEVSGSGQVGSGQGFEATSPTDQVKQAPSSAISEDADALIGSCLPEWMQAMDRTGVRQVAAMLAERIAAGWTPAQIRSLMGEKPASGVRRMSSLVAYRLDENAGVADAPNARLSVARQASEATREAARIAQAEAIAAQQEALKTPEERVREAAYSQMWQQMRDAYPQASKVELIALVREAMNQVNDHSKAVSA